MAEHDGGEWLCVGGGGGGDIDCFFFIDTRNQPPLLPPPLQSLVRRRALLKRTPEDHRRAAATAPGGEMPRVLSRVDLTLLSLGAVIGAGVFVLTGVAAAEHGGPSVVLGYLLAGAAALLCALCYTEFAAALPVAGGAVTFVGVVFGELAAVIVGAQLVLEYVLSVATIARAASAYLGALFGLRPGALLIHVGRALSLDVLAASLVAGLATLLARGTRQSATFNTTVTLVCLIAAAYTLAAGAPLARASNLTPFLGDGARGVFASAGIVFYAFVNFDTVANAAEEARDPSADLPFAIVASVTGAGVLYAALALVLVAAVPRASIDHGAPFASMFSHHFAAAQDASSAARVLLATSGRFVSFGVLAGLVSAALATQLGAARVVVFLARERLLPARLAAVDAATGAPAVATFVTSAVAAALALTVDVADLAALVSVGTLTVLAAVAAALLKRRYSPPGSGHRAAAALVALFLLSAAFSASITFGAPAAAVAAAVALWAAAASSFCLLPVAYAPAGFRVPLTPLTPSLAVLATVQLALALGVAAYIRLAVWTVVALAFYAGYSVHAADAADAAGGRSSLAAMDGGGDAVSLELAVASGLPPPSTAAPLGRGASADDRARLLTVVRVHSEDGLNDPRTPGGKPAPPSPVASDGGASSVGLQGGAAVPIRLSQ